MRRLTVRPRPDWRRIAEEHGFTWHTMYDRPYWDETGCFVFSLEEIEREIEAPTAELHAMCLDFVDFAVRREDVLRLLRIPEPFWSYVAESWRRRDPTLYGRFDLAYTGQGPAKLLEYNADTPTSIYESAYFQWLWLEAARDGGIVGRSADQFNMLQESLIAVFGALPKQSLLHLTCAGESDEDVGTITYLADCAVQAGHRVKLLPIERLGVDLTGRFTDLQDRTIDLCFKLYPWEWLFAETFGVHLARCGAVFLEPPWKAVLSTKALLPLLWQRHAGHPNLLPAYFADDDQPHPRDFVRKPILSREGSNVTLVQAGRIAAAGGPYGEEGFVIQEAAPLYRSRHGHAVLGSWIVGDTAAGLGIREDSSPITRNLSRFLPHVIE